VKSALPGNEPVTRAYVALSEIERPMCPDASVRSCSAPVKTVDLVSLRVRGEPATEPRHLTTSVAGTPVAANRAQSKGLLGNDPLKVPLVIDALEADAVQEVSPPRTVEVPVPPPDSVR
jgi:hypothetical protein